MYVLCYSKSDKYNIERLFPKSQYNNIYPIHISEFFCLKNQILNIFDPIAREFDDKYFLGEEKAKEIKEKETKPETNDGNGEG